MKGRVLVILLALALVLSACGNKSNEGKEDKEPEKVVETDNNGEEAVKDSDKDSDIDSDKDSDKGSDKDSNKDTESDKEVSKLTQEEFEELRAAIINGEDVELPKKFDLRDYGMVTSCKDQNGFMCCWVFGAMGALESNALMSGFGEYDFSEYQLAILSETIPAKQGGSIGGEGYVCDDSIWYDHPGMSIYTVNTFMKGYAPALEEDYPYWDIKKPISVGAIDDAVFRVDNCFMVTPKTPDLIKKLIIENGAVTIGVNSVMWDFGRIANCSRYTNIIHYVTLVGWDDTYESKEITSTPEKDGVWIIKDSGGRAWGDEGYLYLSYCDGVMNGNNVIISYTLTDKESYDYQYQYDGSAGLGTVKDLTDVAISFTANDNETMTGVKIFPRLTGGAFEPVNATVKVYKNIGSIDEADIATPIYSMDTKVIYAGYQTLEFDEGVNINKNDKTFVTVTFDRAIRYAEDSSMKRRTKGMHDDIFRYHTVTHANPGETFVKRVDDDAWQDRALADETSSMCIKVMVRKGHNKEVIHRKWVVK